MGNGLFSPKVFKQDKEFDRLTVNEWIKLIN